MDFKFDLDELKKFIDLEENKNSDSDITLESILADFKKTPEDIDASAKTELIESETVVKTEQKNAVINTEIQKPAGVSITGAFEAIKFEKNVDEKNVVIEPVKHEISVIEAPVTDVSNNLQSKEITDEIIHKRYFDTDTFNSIKNDNKVGVKNPLKSFISAGDEEDDGEEEYFKPVEPTEEIDDYDDLNDRDDILVDLKKMKASASIKSIISFILMIISAVFFMTGYSEFKLTGLDPVNNSKLYLTLVYSVSVALTVVNINSFKNGIKSFFKFKCSTETLLAFAFIFITALDVNYLFSNVPPVGTYVIFDFIYTLLMFFNIYSKNILTKNILKNFLIVSSDGKKTVVNKPVSEEIANDIILETGSGGDIVYASKSDFVSDFIVKSFRDYDNSLGNAVVSTCFLLIVLCLTAVNYFMTGSFALAFTYSAGALCVIIPVLHNFAFAVPLFSNCRKARKYGGAIIGSTSSYELNDVQTLIVDDSDVFDVKLNGIRLNGNAMIDDAILYLNSLYKIVGGPLKKLFEDMLSSKITSLPRIDDIYYHDTMGYSCLIHSKTFVAGNKHLMDHFGIEVDDSDYELIYQQKSKHVLFVAYDGKLLGVFLLSYTLGYGVDRALEFCEKNQIHVAIAERDANVNDATLFGNYKTNERYLFKIMNFRTARNCFDKFITQKKTPSLLVSNTGLKGIAAALHGCKSMVFAFKANNVVKTMSSIIALILITFLLFFSNPTSMLPLHILVYQLLWSLPVLFVSMFSK